MYGGPIGTHQRSFGQYHPRLFMASPYPRLGVCNLAGTGKATDFKFDRYIYRSNPDKSTLKVWRKWSMGVSWECPTFWGYPLLFLERVKLRISNFEGTFIKWIRTKAHENVGNSSRGRSQGVPKILMAPCIGHTARSSLR